MTDSWEKRNLPHTLGYNNPTPAVLTFSVTYDSGADELKIQASHAVFTPCDTINFDGTGGNGVLSVGPDFTVDTPWHITIPNAQAALLAPTTLDQLDFYAPIAILIGTWTGSAVVATAITLTSAVAGPGAGELTVNGTGLTGGTTLVVYYNGGGSQLNFWPYGGNDSTVVLNSPVLEGETVTAVELYADFPPTILIDSLTGLSELIPSGVEALSVSYDSGTDTITITSPGGNFIANTTDYVFVHSSGFGGADLKLPLNPASPGVSIVDPNTIEIVGQLGVAFAGYIKVVDVINNDFIAVDTHIGEFIGSVDASDPNAAVVETFSAPSDNTVQIDGFRLQTASNGAVNRVSIGTDMAIFTYDMTDIEVISFTDNQIVITDPAMDGATIDYIDYRDTSLFTRSCNWAYDWLLNPQPGPKPFIS